MFVDCIVVAVYRLVTATRGAPVVPKNLRVEAVGILPSPGVQAVGISQSPGVLAVGTLPSPGVLAVGIILSPGVLGPLPRRIRLDAVFVVARRLARRICCFLLRRLLGGIGVGFLLLLRLLLSSAKLLALKGGILPAECASLS
jgi:hypothetical protein